MESSINVMSIIDPILFNPDSPLIICWKNMEKYVENLVENYVDKIVEIISRS